jgi:hypothetical protein
VLLLKLVHIVKLAYQYCIFTYKDNTFHFLDVSQQRKELENHGVIDSKDDTVISLLNNFQLVPLNRKPG